jgi:hypothetical protein
VLAGNVLSFRQWRAEATGDAQCSAISIAPDRGASRPILQFTSDTIDSGLGIAVDEQGNRFVSGGFVQRVTLPGAPLQSAGLSDNFVLQLDARGQVQKSFRLGTAQADWGLGFAASAQGVVLTGATKEAD